jgi:hypothetical protein
MVAASRALLVAFTVARVLARVVAVAVAVAVKVAVQVAVAVVITAMTAEVATITSPNMEILKQYCCRVVFMFTVLSPCLQTNHI